MRHATAVLLLLVTVWLVIPLESDAAGTPCGPADLREALNCPLEWDHDRSVPAHWLIPTERYVEYSFALRCDLRSPRALACMAASPHPSVRRNHRFTRRWMAMLRSPRGERQAAELVWNMRRRSQDDGYTVPESDHGCGASGSAEASPTTPHP